MKEVRDFIEVTCPNCGSGGVPSMTVCGRCRIPFRRTTDIAGFGDFLHELTAGLGDARLLLSDEGLLGKWFGGVDALLTYIKYCMSLQVARELLERIFPAFEREIQDLEAKGTLARSAIRGFRDTIEKEKRSLVDVARRLAERCPANPLLAALSCYEGTRVDYAHKKEEFVRNMQDGTNADRGEILKVQSLLEEQLRAVSKLNTTLEKISEALAEYRAFAADLRDVGAGGSPALIRKGLEFEAVVWVGQAILPREMISTNSGRGFSNSGGEA